MTNLALLSALQANFIAYFRQFAEALDEAEIYESDEVMWFTRPGAPGSQVLRTHFQRNSVDVQIQATFSKIGKRVNGVRWLVLPSCQPVHLADRLKAHGLKHHPGDPWMVAELADLPELPESVRVEPVKDKASLVLWLELQAAGWEAPLSLAKVYHDTYAHHGFAETATATCFIAYQQDTPVSSGTLLLDEGIAGLYNIATPPAYRQSGFGRAVTLAMMQVAYEKGYSFAGLQASEVGLGVYQRLGFREIYREQAYFWNK